MCRFEHHHLPGSEGPSEAYPPPRHLADSARPFCVQEAVMGWCSHGLYCQYRHGPAPRLAPEPAPAAAAGGQAGERAGDGDGNGDGDGDGDGDDEAAAAAAAELVEAKAAYAVAAAEYAGKAQELACELVAVDPERAAGLAALMARLKESIEPRPSDESMRQAVCNAVHAFVEDAMPNLRRGYVSTSSLHLFGSSANGFGSRSSDVDVSMEMRLPRNRIARSNVISNVINTLGKKMRAAPEFARDVKWITGVKIPLIKFVHVDSGLSVDFSIGNSLALRNTRLQKCYASLDERVRDLMYTIKYWGKARKINDAAKRTLSSYALTIMLFHYLQAGLVPPVLPVLQTMPGGSTEGGDPVRKPRPPPTPDAAAEGESGKEGKGKVPARKDKGKKAGSGGGDEAGGADSGSRSGSGSDSGSDKAEDEVTKPRVFDDSWKRDESRDPSLPSVRINGYETYFCNSLPAVRTAFPVGANAAPAAQLLLGFFDYYANSFPVETHVACIRRELGHSLTKAEKSWESAMLAVEDPFELNHNLTAMVSGEYWELVHSEFVRAYNLLFGYLTRAPHTPDRSPDGFMDVLCAILPEREFHYEAPPKKDGRK
ncbi:uncharacterized protein AMSG_11735 [Thecamonas trahens ATCC 50062]|uniref:C3H1-type domain-containing protein n=1 Tax=Thecamonas trahens ATCC 50062 TaxID=461836 RepID=A0A0L0D2Y9_THETB|nr:hypothetical protein AMSG_11735 [Thecamonas trahens ATCC 50062]KNC46540.1 hypothetical protein AMSG_11735 [Thecamonas trahens ATCC 50062]|eukprot:XP_013760484.1 hypothetical protein AMSG_11735 [Thecamonas trahens ATCC 50062]